jgi:hypothetical protein
VITPKGNDKKVNIPKGYQQKSPGGQTRKPLASGPTASNSIENELAKLRAAATAVQKIRLSAQHELELAKRMRAEAQRYQQETETKARSQAQQLILRTRLATQKEIEELIGKASAEIQKVLADIRVIRITAQEELAILQKFTDAARIRSLSHKFKEEPEEPPRKRERQLSNKK